MLLGLWNCTGLVRVYGWEGPREGGRPMWDRGGGSSVGTQNNLQPHVGPQQEAACPQFLRTPLHPQYSRAVLKQALGAEWLWQGSLPGCERSALAQVLHG